jgi:hypothetical protein
MWAMPYKTRSESVELRTLKYLNSRMSLAEKDKMHYFNLKKGYEGEVVFDTFTENLQGCLILNDLLLKVNNITFQIDTLIIHSETINLYEVKNYEGDYFYESERFYRKPKVEVNNPLHQINRSESLLRQLLHNLGYTIPIHGSVVFVNPEFNLYQSPLNLPFISPTQISSHFRKINKTNSRINEKHKLLANKLISLHIENSPFTQLPSYEYENLKKGIICKKCNSFSLNVKGKNVICLECGNEEIVEDAVLRSVKEYQFLFPNQKVTTNIIQDWCKIIPSKKTIRRILHKNYQIIGVHQWAYYQ